MKNEKGRRDKEERKGSKYKGRVKTRVRGEPGRKGREKESERKGKRERERVGGRGRR